MKKILSLMALMMVMFTTAWAGEVATFDLGTKPGISTPDGFFTHEAATAAGKWNFNTKFNGAEYDGMSFSQGLKMEGATAIDFTTEYVSTVTIVQSTWSAATIKFDGEELAVAKAEEGTGCRIYTLTDVAAGDHVIARGSGESGLFYIKVEWQPEQTVTFINDAEWEKVFVWAWNGDVNYTGGTWPGVELTGVEGIYQWKTTGDPAWIVFSNGAESQTADLKFKDGGIYNSTGRIITLNDYTATFTTDGMDEVWAYVWNGEEEALGEWPGTQMTPGNGDGDWMITIKAEEAPKYIIFHNNAGEQTPDWEFVDGKAYEYMLNDYSATFTTDAGWTDVYAYAWTSGDPVKEFAGEWPGTKLSANDGVFAISLKAFNAPEKIVFNNGSDEGKTADLPFINGKDYKWITATPLYALNEGDTFASGTTVEVKDGEDVVATLTYGVDGGEDFLAAVADVNEDYAGFGFYTPGNGVNGGIDNGTVYTIVPNYEGTITIGVRLNGNKAMHINEDGTDMDGFNGYKIAQAANTSFTFEVKAGSTYKIWCDGSKLGFFGFDFKKKQAQAGEVTFDFSDPNFRTSIGDSMTDVAGYIYNETFIADEASLNITAGSAPSRIYNDNNRGQCLVIYKEYATLTFRAPADMVITKIEFTPAGNSNINNFTASSGEIEGMTWTGRDTGVRFLQGGTSYLAKATLTLEAADGMYGELPAISYAECENIAAFNALEAGTYAKVHLNDAEIIGKSADGYSTLWIQDATGGAWMQYTSLNDYLEEGKKVNGAIYVVKRVASGNPQMKEAEDTPFGSIMMGSIDSYTTIEGKTISEVNIPDNLNRVVKLTGATLEETSATAGKLTIGDETISVNNGSETANQQLHKIAEWAKDTKLENITIVAILVAKSATENQLLPISIEEAQPEPQYYLAGNMNDWTPADEYKLVLNTEATGEEYMINVELDADAQFKVVKVEGETQTWYPDGRGNAYGENGELTAAGSYTVYFRPNADGGDDWFHHVIYVASNITDGIEAVNVAAQQGQVYNMAGQRIANAKKGLYIVDGKKLIVK